MLPLTALMAALVGAGIAVGVMAWEPWQDNEDTTLSLPSRLASCDNRIPTSEGPLRKACYWEARNNLAKWQCYVTWGITFVESRNACLSEASQGAP